MKVKQNHVVSLHYTLKNDAGEVLDSSAHGPLDYIHGHGMIVPGLEKSLEGRQIGERFSVSVSPEEGYGELRRDLIQEVPIEAFQGVAEVKPGMSFVAHGPQGQMMVTVTAVKDRVVEIDGNHPLAGKNLHFDIEVVQVREATADELQFGLRKHGCCGGHGGDSCCGGHEHGEAEEHECCGSHGSEDHECCGGHGHGDGGCCGRHHH